MMSIATFSEIARISEIVRTRERARKLFGAGSELGERVPLPFAMTDQLRQFVVTNDPTEVGK